MADQIVQEKPLGFELKHQYQGPSWVKDYIYDAHSFYTGKKETVPLNMTPADCAAYLQRAPYTRVEVNLLPLITELNKTSRNFFATSKDKKKVLDSYHDWVKMEGSYPAAINYPKLNYESFYNETDLPSPSRLCSTFEIDLSDEEIFTRVFWLSKDGWKMEVEECSKAESQPKKKKLEKPIARKDEDSDGNYIDYPASEKLESGQRFRTKRKGLAIFDWIAAPCELEPFHELDPETFDHPPEFEVIATATPPSIAQKLSEDPLMDDNTTSPRNSSLDPKDSCSNADRHNFKNDRAAQGWDDDTSIGELGWDVPGTKEVINSSGNVEVGCKTPLRTVLAEEWKVVQPKKKRNGKGKGKGGVSCW